MFTAYPASAAAADDDRRDRIVRPATAGGFDGRPPQPPRTGQVIPFPVERVRKK